MKKPNAKMMPRPTMVAAMPLPALAPALRELEERGGVGEAGGGVLDAEGESLLIEDMNDAEDVGDAKDVENAEDMEDVEDVEDAEDVEDIEDVEDAKDVGEAEDVEDVEDVVKLLVGEVEETDVVELDALCIPRDSGEGAKKVSLPGSM